MTEKEISKVWEDAIHTFSVVNDFASNDENKKNLLADLKSKYLQESLTNNNTCVTGLETKETLALAVLLKPVSHPDATHTFSIIWAVNDGNLRRYSQPTPKQRILAALYDIKKMQQPHYADITKELAVLPVNEIPDTKQIKQSVLIMVKTILINHSFQDLIFFSILAKVINVNPIKIVKHVFSE